MSKFKLIITISFLLFFAGCSTNYPFPGKIGLYENLATSTHTEDAIFEGRAFIYSSHITVNVGTPVYFLGCTKNKAIHFEKFNLNLEATPFDVHFYEAPTITLNGTPLNGKNLDRNFNDTHELNLFGGPTINNTGTQLFHATEYGDKHLTGDTAIPSEMILRVNTCYLFEIINNNGVTADVTANFVWHESKLNY